MVIEEKLIVFVTCSPGLEEILKEELLELGYQDIRQRYAGIYVGLSHFSQIYELNYSLRVASRILLPLSSFRCPNRNSLYQEALKINWSLYLDTDKTFAIDANVHHPELKNSLYAAQVVKDAICDKFKSLCGKRPNVDVKNPDVQFNLFIDQGRGILSFDTSLTPLHKRGYRLDAGKAPLQESLAAALLKISGFTKDHIFLDPCCGSGTLLMEAALIASNTAPGYLRKNWGFFSLPQYSSKDWLKVKAKIDEKRIEIPPGALFGIEIDPETVDICKRNVKACGFLKAIEIIQGDFREIEIKPLPNFILTNPPYGKRLEEISDLKPLYRALGDFMKRKTAKPAKGFVLSGETLLSKEVGLKASHKHIVNNGGIDSRLLAYDLY